MKNLRDFDFIGALKGKVFLVRRLMMTTAGYDFLESPVEAGPESQVLRIKGREKYEF